MAFDETVLAGTTGWSIDVLMRDSSTGLPKTGIDAADVQFSYVRAGGAAPTEWYELSSSTWQELSSTYAPGLYRLTVPDGAVASGAHAVTLFISAGGAIPRCLRIGLINANLRDATRLGLSALPNAAAGSSGGLPTVDANNAVKLQSGSGANQILLNSGQVTVGTNSDKSGYSLSSAALADVANSVWNAATRTLTSFGTLAADTAAAVWSSGSRTLTSFGTLVSDIWSAATRTLTGIGSSGIASSAEVTDVIDAVSGVNDEVGKLTGMTETAGTPAYRRYKQSALEMTPAAGLTPQQAAQLANADAMATEWDGMVVNGVFTADALQNAPTGTGGFTTQDRDTLNAIRAKTDSITSSTVTVAPPVGQDMTLTVVAGETTSAVWTSSNWPDTTGATLTLVVESAGQKYTVGATRVGNQVTATLTPTLTRQLAGRNWTYGVWAVLNASTAYALAYGPVVVRTVPRED